MNDDNEVFCSYRCGSYSPFIINYEANVDISLVFSITVAYYGLIALINYNSMIKIQMCILCRF